ncbi:hypothetical protein [Leptospira idonii]|uniref:Uncharacterized protein n=1 Tax=Leptospira idonii TaxID=1193500 RepID=A0A4R9M8E8_9LEPT|nr:hypothetical protein [Leptospira idonii]TGN20808.1 hypothetical protein EHS15_01865 [Leptospira idonii]
MSPHWFTTLSPSMQWVVVAASIVTSWLALFLLSKFLRTRNVEIGGAKFNKISTADFLHREGEYEFSDHPVFGTIEKLVSVDLYSIHLEDEFRDILMKTMVRIAWESYKENLNLFLISSKQAKNYLQLKKEMVKCVTSSLTEARKSFREESVPEVVIEKYLKSTNLFNVILLDYIEKISTSHRTKIDLIDLFLKFISSTAVATHQQFEFLFSSINGHLKGLEFKGVTCK